MNVSLDVCSKSLNKREEELCGDTVEIVKTTDADIIILPYFADWQCHSNGLHAVFNGLAVFQHRTENPGGQCG